MDKWESRMIYTRPEEEQVFLVREPQVGMVCSSCGGSDIRKYPVANHQGPWMLTRCQDCFFIVSRDRPLPDDMWPPFRSVTYDWETSPSERAARIEFDRTTVDSSKDK